MNLNESKGNLKLDMRGNFAVVRTIRHWNRLLTAAMESLQFCRNKLDKHLSGVP